MKKDINGEPCAKKVHGDERIAVPIDNKRNIRSIINGGGRNFIQERERDRETETESEILNTM